MTTILACHSLPCYVDYLMIEKKKLGTILKRQEVAIPRFSEFLANRYVQCVDVGWNRKPTLQNYTYVIPEGCNLKDAVMLSYICSLGHQEGLVSGVRASKGEVVERQVKRGGQVVENGSGPDESPQQANDQESAGTSMEDDKRRSEESTIGGWEMSLQGSIIHED